MENATEEKPQVLREMMGNHDGRFEGGLFISVRERGTRPMNTTYISLRLPSGSFSVSFPCLKLQSWLLGKSSEFIAKSRCESRDRGYCHDLLGN